MARLLASDRQRAVHRSGASAAARRTTPGPARTPTTGSRSLLLDWSAGAVSAIHDHGGQHCWLVVVAGPASRGRFRAGRCRPRAGTGVARSPRIARARGRASLDLRSGPFDIHRVCADEHAMSLHVYARPLDEFSVYDERAHRCSHASADATIGALSLFAGSAPRDDSCDVANRRRRVQRHDGRGQLARRRRAGAFRPYVRTGRTRTRRRLRHASSGYICSTRAPRR